MQDLNDLSAEQKERIRTNAKHEAKFLFFANPNMDRFEYEDLNAQEHQISSMEIFCQVLISNKANFQDLNNFYSILYVFEEIIEIMKNYGRKDDVQDNNFLSR